MTRVFRAGAVTGRRHARVNPSFLGSLAATSWLAVALGAQAAGSGTLLVLNKSDDTVSLLDGASGKPVATVATGSGPHEVAVSPDGRTAVICNYGDQARPGNTLSVLDIGSRKMLRTIDLAQNPRPHGIAWLHGSEVLVTTEGSKALLIVDIAAGRVAHRIETDQEVSHMVAVAPKHQRAFVANIGSGSVTVVDLQGKRRIANIATGAGAEGIDISPDQSEVWVTNRAANTLSVLDVATLKVIATPASKDFPIRAKFTADGQHVLVSNARSGDLAVFDARSKQEVRRIAMQVQASEAASGSKRLFGGQFGQSPVPVGILVVPQLSRAFIANTNADIVSVVDLTTWQIVARWSAGKEPDGLGYSPLSAQ